jgi:hypothetical protein
MLLIQNLNLKQANTTNRVAKMSRTPRDLCKGCRECYNGILQAVVKNPIVAAIMMGIPSYFMISCLLFDGITIINPEYYAMKNTIVAPFYTLLGFTIAAWIVEIIAVHWMLPNVLSMCAFGHSAVGSWWLVNLGILMFAGWSYLPVKMVFLFMLSILTPAIIWHIAGDIIREYKRKLIEQINLQSQALAQQEIAFSSDETVGKPKISNIV